MVASQLRIRPFMPADQEDARRLILEGLAQRWQRLDAGRNPDLDDIGASYRDGVFLVAYLGKRLVGTGALVPEAEGIGRIVRMSVAEDVRRQGIGGRLLAALIQQGRRCGYRRIVLETTASWSDAIAFYRKHGFVPKEVRDGDLHFFSDLT